MLSTDWLTRIQSRVCGGMVGKIVGGYNRRKKRTESKYHTYKKTSVCMSTTCTTNTCLETCQEAQKEGRGEGRGGCIRCGLGREGKGGGRRHTHDKRLRKTDRTPYQTMKRNTGQRATLKNTRPFLIGRLQKVKHTRAARRLHTVLSRHRLRNAHSKGGLPLAPGNQHQHQNQKHPFTHTTEQNTQYGTYIITKPPLFPTSLGTPG